MPKRPTGARPLAEATGTQYGTIEGQHRENQCYQSALRWLSRRARTEAETRRYLSGKGFEENVIDNVVERLKTSGLLDDAAFAQNWSDFRSRNSPRSAVLVRRELKLKGVAEEEAAEAVSVLDDDEAAFKAASARTGRLHRLPAEEAQRKLSDFLRRRGFSWELTRRTLNRLEAEGLLKPVDTSD